MGSRAKLFGSRGTDKILSASDRSAEMRTVSADAINRTGLRQAQDIAARNRPQNRRRYLQGHRPTPRQLHPSGMRKLFEKRRICVSLKAECSRKSARRDACASGKRFDADCRLVSPTLGVAPGGPPASSKASTVAQGYAFRPSPSRSTPPGAMTTLSW